MADIESALSRTSGQHRLALEWFRSNAGREVSWAEMKAYAEAGARRQPGEGHLQARVH